MNHKINLDINTRTWRLSVEDDTGTYHTVDNNNPIVNNIINDYIKDMEEDNENISIRCRNNHY